MSIQDSTEITGHVGNDPEMRYMQDGTAVLNLSVAVNSKFTDRNGEKVEKTKWYSCSFWGKRAEIASQYIKKGERITVRGEVSARAYADKQTGEARASLDLRVDEFLLPARAGGNGSGDAQGQSQSETDDIPF